MTFIATFLGGIWTRVAGYVLAAGAVLAILFGAWRKGVTDERSKAKLEDVTNANTILKDSAGARAGVDTSPERLRDDDGWRRD